MHESVAKALFARYKRTLTERVQRHNRSLGNAPRTRKAWFKHAVARCVHAPGTLQLTTMIPTEGAGSVTSRGKSWRVHFPCLVPVSATDNRKLGIAWELVVVFIDARRFDIEARPTKVIVTDHALERTIQRLGITDPEDALLILGTAIQHMPICILEGITETFLVPIKAKGEGSPLVGAYVVTPDSEFAERIAIVTFLAQDQLTDAQLREIDTVYSMQCRSTGTLTTLPSET